MPARTDNMDKHNIEPSEHLVMLARNDRLLHEYYIVQHVP